MVAGSFCPQRAKDEGKGVEKKNHAHTKSLPSSFETMETDQYVFNTGERTLRHKLARRINVTTKGVKGGTA